MQTIRSLNETAYRDGRVSNLMFRDGAMMMGMDVDDPAVCERYITKLIGQIEAAIDEAESRDGLLAMLKERELMVAFGWLQKLTPEKLQPVLEKSRAKFA